MHDILDRVTEKYANEPKKVQAAKRSEAIKTIAQALNEAEAKLGLTV